MHKINTLPFNNSFALLPGDFYSRVDPTPFADPYLISFNDQAAALIELDPNQAQDPEFPAYINGDKTIPGSDSLAMLYAGHQFGGWVPQLGDGRAMMIGEVRNSLGDSWELQLKGSGQTPYSRSGDGRAVLRSTIREYLCSEAMHGLGIPTTRALCMIGSDDEVYRERIETGAILVRMAPSHVRFGSFECFASRNQPALLAQLADYVIDQHYPQFSDLPDRHLRFYKEIIQRTAHLMAQWQTVGFAHGVMNTDNMSVLGLTLDYGPFGFLDAYQPGYICNHSDHRGRYAFDQQPAIGHWNLARLGEALNTLISDEDAQNALEEYAELVSQQYSKLMRNKYGLSTSQAEDAALIMDSLDLLAENKVDHTIFFRRLSRFQVNHHNSNIRDLFLNRPAFDQWATRYTSRLKQDPANEQDRIDAMLACNPKYILRNHLLQIAIEKAVQKDYSEIERLLTLLRTPYDEQPEMEAYADFPPDWAQELEISCSS